MRRELWYFQQSSPDESAENIFLKAAAYLRNWGKSQIPVMECLPERMKKNLFGTAVPLGNRGNLIMVTKIIGDTVVELGAGFATGLTPHSLLTKRGDITGARIWVNKVKSLMRSEGGVARADKKKVKAGDFFEVVEWGVPDRPNLCVYAPPAEKSFEELTAFGKKFESWVRENNFIYITDPSVESPWYTLYYTSEGWKMKDIASRFPDLMLGKVPDFKKLKQVINKEGKVFFYLQLPPVRELPGMLDIGKGRQVNAVEFTNEAGSQYTLAGRFVNGQLSYAWLIPGVTWSDSTWTSTLPVATDWVSVSPDSVKQKAEVLTMLAAKLGKIRGWLTLQAPADGGNFPFYFGLRNNVTGEIITEKIAEQPSLAGMKGLPENEKISPGINILKEDEEYGLVLFTDPNKYDRWNRAKKWVYVFAIDHDGKTILLYPLYSNMGDDPMPYGADYRDYWILGPNPAFSVGTPFGYDTYFMLACDENILSPKSVFESDGVRTRGKGGGGSALRSLLINTGSAQRGFNPSTPSEWQIQKVTVRSVEKN